MNLPVSISTVTKSLPKIDVDKVLNLASPIIAILTSIAVVFFVVWPRFSQVMQFRTSNRELAIRSESLASKAAQLTSLDSIMLGNQLVGAEQLLPSDTGIFTLISQVEQAATSSGIILSRVEVSPGAVSTASDKPSADAPPAAPSAAGDEGGSGASSVSLKISTKSDYPSYLQFLRSLLTKVRIIDIKDMGLAAASGTNQIQVSLTVEGYWQTLPADLPPVEQQIQMLSDAQTKLLKDAYDKSAIDVPVTSDDGPALPLGRSDLFAPF